MFITSFLIGFIYIPGVNANSIDTLDYKFEKDILFDDFDSLNKTKVNLRHNNIITDDYNGTYSFINDTIGNAPIGWNNLSVGNGDAKVSNYFNRHKSILNLSVINADDAKIEQIFDDGIQTDGIIEFWFGSSDCTYINNVQIVSDGTIGVFFRIYSDLFQYYDSDWQNLDITPLDNVWYHIKFNFDCITDTIDIYINDYYEGNYDFINLVNSFNRIWFENVDTAIYSSFFDAIGYSWSSNYTINENKYPILEIIDSNILSSDKYDFNLDSDNNPYPITGYPEIYGWDKVYDTESHIYLDMDNSENGVEILGELDGCGIKNDTLQLYGNKINITFELRFISMYELDSYLNFTVISINNISIIELKFDTLANGISNLSYFNGIDYIDLVIISNINENDIYSFNLYIYDYSVDLSWYKDNIYNNTYNFDLISNEYNINNISFLIYDENTNDDYLVIKLNSIGIYQYNISLCRELGYLDYDLETTWDFNKYNIFEFISNQSIKIVVYGALIYPEVYYIIREFDNKDYFGNLQGIDKYISLAHIFVIIKTNFTPNDLLFSIEGIILNKYINNVFDTEKLIHYYYHNVNINHSYYYVDNLNRLCYRLNITQNDTSEYMMLYFDFARHISSNNMSIYFKCRELSISIGESYIAMTYYQPPDNRFDLKTYETTINHVLISEKEFNRFYFVSWDKDDNNYTNYIGEGYLYGLKFNYIGVPVVPLDRLPFLTLSLIEIMIPLIILIVPTIGIYSVYRKKEIIIPVLALMSIICFVSALIPFELFFIMLICFSCGIFIQYKKGSIE